MANSIIRIILHEESKDRLTAYCDKAGMTQIKVMSRLVDWFMEQPAEMQGIIQGHIKDAKAIPKNAR